MSSDNSEFALRLIKGVLDNFPAFVIVVDSTGNFLYKNAAVTDDICAKIHEIDFAHIHGAVNSNDKSLTYEVETEDRFFQVTDSAATWINENKVRLVVGADITEIKKSEANFKKSAKTDFMTGVFNRQTALDTLDESISELKNGGNIFTVCYLDINDLKYTNDTFGHAIGDEYIMSVVAVIKSAIRQTDFFARVGGDEFLLIFPKCKYDVVENIMGIVTTKFEMINQAKGIEPFHSISFGILEVSDATNVSSEFVMNAADSKMYYMKEDYRNSKKQ